MTEFLILSAGLLLLVWKLSGRGADRLAKPWVAGAFMGYGAQTGAFLEMMPFSRFHANFSLRTVVAAMIGVFSMRLLARGVRAWAAGYRDEDRGATRDQARLLHPLVAVGIAISGVLMLHEGAASRHLALEIERTPRNGETGIVRGAEPVHLAGVAGGPAVLVLHGFFGSPADLGALPETLHAAGFAVDAPLTPGHGTTPRDLVETSPDAWRTAALEAFDALAAEHETVHVVGFSMGGWLALEVAAARDAGRVVVLNPYLGETWTPGWMPFSTDATAEFLAPLVAYLMRTDSFVRLSDRSMLDHLRAYHTVPISTTVALTHASSDSLRNGLLDSIDEPLLALISEGDRVTPAETARRVLGPLEKRGDAFRLQTFDKSDHILLLDFDRDAATAAAVEWLSR